MLFAEQSKQYKSLGKVVILPTIFNINEPVIFGFPIVMSPLMFIPFILVPFLAGIVVYGSIVLGFITPFSGVIYAIIKLRTVSSRLERLNTTSNCTWNIKPSLLSILQASRYNCL